MRWISAISRKPNRCSWRSSALQWVDLGSPSLVRGSSQVKCQRSNTLNKPVLDQETFQQLLAAASTLQQQNDRLLVEASKVDFAQTLPEGAIAKSVGVMPLVSLTPGPLAETEPALESVLPIAQSDVEPSVSPLDSALEPETNARIPVLPPQFLEDPTFKQPQSKPAPLMMPVCQAVPNARSGSRDRAMRSRISQRTELFWSAATVAALAAVSALLMGGSIHRLSPLPASLTLPSEVLGQPVPFRRAKRIGAVLAQSGGAGTKTMVMEPDATKSEPTAAVVADESPRRSATPGSGHKTILGPKHHSSHESEGEIVAQDTVVRYCARSSAQAQIPNSGAR